MRRGSSLHGGSSHAHLGLASPYSPGATSLWVGSGSPAPSPTLQHRNDIDGLHNDDDRDRSFRFRDTVTVPESRDGHKYVVVSVRDSSSQYRAGRRRSDPDVLSDASSGIVYRQKTTPAAGHQRPTSAINLGRSSSVANSNSSARTKISHQPAAKVVRNDSVDAYDGPTSPTLINNNSSATRSASRATNYSNTNDSNVVNNSNYNNNNALTRSNSTVTRSPSRITNNSNNYNNNNDVVRRSNSVKYGGNVASASQLFEQKAARNSVHTRKPSYLPPTTVYGNAAGSSDLYANGPYVLGGNSMSNSFSNLSLLAGNTSNLMATNPSLFAVGNMNGNTTNLLATSLNGSTSNLLANGGSFVNPALGLGVGTVYNGLSFYPAVAPSLATLPQAGGISSVGAYNSNNSLKEQLTDPEYLAKSLQETLSLVSGGGGGGATSPSTLQISSFGVSSPQTYQSLQSPQPYQPMQSPQSNQPLQIPQSPLYVGQNLAVSPYQNLSTEQQLQLLNAALASSPNAYFPSHNQPVYGQGQQQEPYLGHTFEILSAAVAAGQVKSPPSSSATSTPPPFSPTSMSLDPHLPPSTLSGFSTGHNGVKSPPPVPPKFVSSTREAADSEVYRRTSTASLTKQNSFNAMPRPYSGHYRDDSHLRRTSSLDAHGDETTTSGLGSSIPSSPSDWSPTSPRNDLRMADGQGQGSAVTYSLVDPIYDRPRDRDACMKCGKKVYAMEKLGPVKDVLYHKTCFTCRVCHVTLNLKSFHHNDEDLADLGVYCSSHKPCLRSNTLDSQALGIKRALTAPRQEMVNDQIRGGSEAGKNTHVDCNTLGIRAALNTPAPTLQTSIKPKEGAWFREQRKYDPMPPRDVIKSEEHPYRGSSSLYVETS